MIDSADSRAELLDRLARTMKQPEGRMHSTADVLPEPARTELHERANGISERARGYKERAHKARHGGE